MSSFNPLEYYQKVKQSARQNILKISPEKKQPSTTSQSSSSEKVSPPPIIETDQSQNQSIPSTTPVSISFPKPLSIPVPSKTLIFRKDPRKLPVISPNQDKNKISIVQKNIKLHPAISRLTCNKFGVSTAHHTKSHHLHRRTLGRNQSIDFIVEPNGNLNFLNRRLSNIGEPRFPGDAINKKIFEAKLQELREELKK